MDPNLLLLSHTGEEAIGQDGNAPHPPAQFASTSGPATLPSVSTSGPTHQFTLTSGPVTLPSVLTSGPTHQSALTSGPATMPRAVLTSGPTQQFETATYKVGPATAPLAQQVHSTALSSWPAPRAVPQHLTTWITQQAPTPGPAGSAQASTVSVSGPQFPQYHAPPTHQPTQTAPPAAANTYYNQAPQSHPPPFNAPGVPPSSSLITSTGLPPAPTALQTQVSRGIQPLGHILSALIQGGGSST